MSSFEVQIRADVDVFAAREAVRGVCRSHGVPLLATHELSIVASELAWNVLKHGGGGVIRVDPVDDPEHGAGVRIVAIDQGPPIRDLQNALRDGWDDIGPIDPALLLRRGGIGGGLGAVLRLTDSFNYEVTDGTKRIEAIRFIRRPRRQPPTRAARAE